MSGNHEYYTGDVDGWLKELEYLGVTPLQNSHVVLTHPKNPLAKLCIAGVDDTEGRFLRLAQAQNNNYYCTRCMRDGVVVNGTRPQEEGKNMWELSYKMFGFCHTQRTEALK